MKIFILVLVVIAFAGCNSQPDMPTKKDYSNPEFTGTIFNKNISLIEVIEKEHHCNLIRYHYLVKSVTKNVDTLAKCIDYILMSTYNKMEREDCRPDKKRCGVFFYTSLKNYKITKSFAFGNYVEMNGMPSISIHPDNMEK